ncbi:TetR family transcriptional regulator [Mycobacterium colombiense]|uniref:TetR family transcriptional regulator n=1 Tax=Mycobacterium colombiense TaxID=339268 RepID=A0A853M9Y1_9MYCO|nr:TetR family transcriptional regulator [Mycobacterium colombiense]OBJ22069.1 TetR family transcriptional regulator [Mycobacterium colombiense]OBJ64141.1 TetR family transcriptional regulator [Mycobacterium colombiense]
MSDDDRPEGSSGTPGTERKGQRTRRQILEAARTVFGDVGYERATIRGIAAVANVDKSSIIKYFGTKQQLFEEAATWTIPIDDVVSADPSKTAENLARGMLAAWAADPNSPMAVLLRASMTSQEAANLLRTHITSHAVGTIAKTIDAPDARLRAALIGAMLMGVASQRYLLQMPDLVDVDTEHLLRLVTPALRAIIDPPD